MKLHLATVRAAIEKFLFAPASPFPLACLRIGVGVTLLLQAYSLHGDVYDLFGSGGIMQGSLGAYTSSTPFSLNWWLIRSNAAGWNESVVLTSLFTVYFIALLGFTIGWKTRIAAIVVWATQLLLTHAQTTSYGLDQFAHLALFMMMFMPIGDDLSVDCRSRGTCGNADWQARLALRTLQIWLCIAYLGSGLTKAVGEQWWTGEAIWRALMLPLYMRFDMAWLAHYPLICRVFALGTLLVESGYAIFIWPRQTRRLWVAATIGLHIGIALFLKLHLFGMIMCVFTFTMFGLSAEPETSPRMARWRMLGWRRATA